MDTQDISKVKPNPKAIMHIVNLKVFLYWTVLSWEILESGLRLMQTRLGTHDTVP